MAVFLVALLAAAGVTLGGHGAVRLARLAAATRSSPVLLGAAWLGGAIAASVAAWAGASLAPLLGAATTAFVVCALLLAALATVALRAGRAPTEPTRSFGAAVLGLAAAQLAAAWKVAAHWEERLPLQSLRYLVAGLLLATALWVAWPDPATG